MMAFYNCTNLTSAVISRRVTTISYGAFYGCGSLTSVAIPDGVTLIGVSAFLGCNSLTDVYYGGSEEQWKQIIIEDSNEPLLNATIHYNSAPAQSETLVSTFTGTPSWCSTEADWAVENGITNGTNTSGTTFSPDRTCGRGEIVTFLDRAYA